VFVALLWAFVFLAGCGQLSDKYGSTSAAPATGVAPWFKVDLNPIKDLVQPYVIYGDQTHVLTEPSYFLLNGQHHLYYEVTEMDPTGQTVIGRTIAYAVSPNGIEWQTRGYDQPVLQADETWEGTGVGAPSVLYEDGRFLMWYSAGEGAGIGLAESTDGLTWVKNPANPVLVPDQTWEGGATGVVASPSVIPHGAQYLMYYSGGISAGPALSRPLGTAIGSAVSDDGVTWTKRDAAGRTSSSNPGAVQPVLTSGQTWEGWDATANSGGAVCCPDVRVDHPVDRDVYRMYYTGNFLGSPVLDDVGIGYAGSFDGLNWDRLQEPYNPIVNEHFPLTLYGITQYITYSQSAPSVVKIGNTYRMLYSQLDIFGTAQGIAIAVNPNPNSL